VHLLAQLKSCARSRDRRLKTVPTELEHHAASASHCAKTQFVIIFAGRGGTAGDKLNNKPARSTDRVLDREDFVSCAGTSAGAGSGYLCTKNQAGPLFRF
jgi:hypothetical protein